MNLKAFTHLERIKQTIRTLGVCEDYMSRAFIVKSYKGSGSDFPCHG